MICLDISVVFYNNFITMKKMLVILVAFIIFPSLLLAQTPEQARRIEEQKRENLRPTEGQTSKVKKKTPPPLDPIDLVYFAELMLKKITYRYDISKAIVILMGVENQFIDLGSQITFLKNENILPKKFDKKEFDVTKPLRKGLTAYMFCKALKIKGGILLTLFGVNQRYALKELVHQGVMSSGNVKDVVSGEELVLILTRAGIYMAKKQKIKQDKQKT